MYYYVVNYKSNHTYIHISREGTFRLVSKLCNSAIDHIFSVVMPPAVGRVGFSPPGIWNFS